MQGNIVLNYLIYAGKYYILLSEILKEILSYIVGCMHGNVALYCLTCTGKFLRKEIFSADPVNS